MKNIIYRSFIYDFLYLLADTSIKRADPCNIHATDTGEIVCMRGRPCCNSCRYLRDNGCTIRCLRCKLYICGGVGEHDRLRDLLCTARKIAYEYDICYIRTTKAEVINRLKTNCLLSIF